MTRVRLLVEIEVPDGATHYTGSLLSDPDWWRYKTNSTGTVEGWQYWDEKKRAWMLYSAHAPHFLQELVPVA